MADMLQDGLEFLRDELIANASSSITYTRGDDDLELTAVYGRTEFDVISDGGMTRFISRDFIINAAELLFSSAVVLPRKNDVITATVAGTEKIFQVLEVNGHCYSRDAHGVMLRVHTKEVG
jgi:hypothetical protein